MDSEFLLLHTEEESPKDFHRCFPKIFSTHFFRTSESSEEERKLEQQIKKRNLAVYVERVNRNLDLWTGEKV